MEWTAVRSRRAEPVDPRRLGVLRAILAIVAGIVVLFMPEQPIPGASLAYVLLAAYLLYSVALTVSLYRGKPLIPKRAEHWVDFLFYASLLRVAGLSEGLPFLFFPILTASFAFGLVEGIAVTAASTLIAGAGVPDGGWYALIVLVPGCLIAYWGASQHRLYERLRLLGEVGKVANPRLGADHALMQSLKRLLDFHGAESSIVVCAKMPDRKYVMYRVDAKGEGGGQRALTDEAAQALLVLPPELSVAWSPKRASRNCPPEQCRRLANLLETACFMSVPFKTQDAPPGRLFLTATKRRFSQTDAAFLAHVVSIMAGAVDCLMLLEQLMQNAAQLERSRISRDIHDTAVQPYIGIKLALEALLRTLEPDTPLANRVRELVEMTTATISDVRGYVARLREDEPGWASGQLMSALRQQTARYRDIYGIDVELRTDEAIPLTDRIAGDVYQIVLEALSNVHRHTDAKRALVELRRRADNLAILVGNQRRGGGKAVAFAPRTIAERAAALGGKVEVHGRKDGQDVVEITIPF